MVSLQSHPLCQPRQLRRTLDEIGAAPAHLALSDLSDWLEAFAGEEEVRPREFAHVLFALDDAMQLHLREVVKPAAWHESETERHPRQLNAARMALTSQLRAYEELSSRVRYDHEFDESDALIAELQVRQIRSAGNTLKWLAFDYRAGGIPLWRFAARAYAEACRAGHADTVLRLGGRDSASSAAREFLRLVALGCAGTDSLVPAEIEATDQLIRHVLPALSISSRQTPGSLFWLDLAHPAPPQRLVRLPDLREDVRYFSPAGVDVTLQQMSELLLAGGDGYALSEGLASVSPLVVRHLMREWAARPPVRSARRHRFACRLGVLPAHDMLRASPGEDMPQPRSAWMLKDVSKTGLAADVPASDLNQYPVGSLVGVRFQEEGSCVLGVVRRLRRDSEASATAGVETLSSNANVVQVDDGRALMSAVACDPVSRERGFRLAAMPGALAAGRPAFVRTGHGMLKLSVVGLLECGNGYDIVACNPV